jgi:hypothetical protein
MKHCHREVNGSLKEMLLTRFPLLLVGPVTSGVTVKYMVTVAVAHPAAVAISLSCSVQHHGEVAGVVTSEKKTHTIAIVDIFPRDCQSGPY